MTRGTIYIILDKLIVETVEFNGDMYPEGFGKEIIKTLEEMDKIDNFFGWVDKFNAENYKYTGNLTYLSKPGKYIRKNVIKLNNADTYFERFGSDWTFWKNLSKKPVFFVVRGNYIGAGEYEKTPKTIELKQGEQVAISFGTYERHYKTEKECIEFIKEEEKQRRQRIENNQTL